MWKHIIVIIVLVFSLGWLSHSMIDSFVQPAEAIEAEPEIKQAPVIKETPRPSSGAERASPYDWVSMRDIHVERNRFWINAPTGYELQWNVLANTNSMDPLMDETSNAIQIIPKSTSDIHIGDIISYETEFGIIIHRVISVGQDKDGWYATTKGDNVRTADPIKVRFKDIKRVVIAVIY